MYINEKKILGIIKTITVANYDDLTNIPIVNADLDVLSADTAKQDQIYRHIGESGTNYKIGMLYYSDGTSWVAYNKDFQKEIDNLKESKVEKDASNLEEDDIVAWQDKLQSNDMPSDTYEDFSISSGGTYTAPADGYIGFRLKKSTSGSDWSSFWIKKPDLTNLYGHAGYIGGSGGTNGFTIPIKKGNLFGASWGSSTVEHARFIYKEGAL